MDPPTRVRISPGLLSPELEFILFFGLFSWISLSICCFNADVSWLIWWFSRFERSITVLSGSLSASRVRISSGLSPHARMISLRASSLLTRVFGFMLSPDDMYMPLRYSVPFIFMS